MKNRLFFILLILLPASLYGQVISSGLTVNTSPPGAKVILDGTVSVNGLSPIGFPSELQGKYKLTIREDGFETLRQTLYLSPNRPLDLVYSLKPKTRYKAAIRSFVIPGWGQMYSGRTGRGLLYTFLAAGAVGYYFITNDDFGEKIDEYERISIQYNSAGTQAEKALIHSSLRNAKQRAYDAENKRIVAIGGVIGIWGLNLIDALFFFPKRNNTAAVHNLTIKPAPDQDGAQIVFSHRF